MELNLYHFSGDLVPVSQLLGQNTGVVELDKMAQIYAVFSDGDFLRMVGSDESVIFFDP
jgi:hypothetical protein